MSNLVTIYGGSGFVGRYIARRMAKAGWRVRVAVRRPNEAVFVKPYGVVGQVEPVFCNIRDDASVAAVMDGADAVINCVGTFDAKGANNFDAVQNEGAARIARIASEQGIDQVVHISAIGADADSDSLYAQSKAKGEAAVLAAQPGAVILRPSVIFGPEDAFFNRFANMARFSPIVPLFGAETRFQPVYVDDVAAAAAAGALGNVPGGIYELGGPEAMSFRGLIKKMLGVIRRERLIVGLPFWLGRIVAWFSDLGRTLSGGLVKGPITRDQLTSLRADTVVTPDAKGLSDIGIAPTAMEAVLEEYLWRYRPSGQYSAIKDSARNLKA